MTTEQYYRLSQFALDLDTSLREYFDEHGSLIIEDENLRDAITAGVNMMHLIHEIPIPPFIKKDGIEEPF